MDKLRAIEIFRQVAEMGSFYKASKILGITPQATSKAIAQIEKHLGTKLLYRNTRQCRLTEEGERFLLEVTKGVSLIENAWEQAHELSSEPRGTLRVTCGLHFGRTVLLPLIDQFQQRFPRIEVELYATDNFVDLVKEGIDVGFRNGLEPSGNNYSQRLFDLQMLACASPDYLRRYGIPDTYHDLSAHTCTGSRQINSGRIEPWEFMENGELIFHHVHSRFWVSDSEVETEAVLRGMGIGLLANLNVAAHIRSGKLVPVLCRYLSHRYGVYLYFPGGKKLSDRASRFIEHARDELLGSSSFQFSVDQLQQLQEKFKLELDGTK
ncbi:LysR family transcriptional regulator [Alteromonas confluentis]|uniref:HTH lysR-type domain-containing protein n=1 Tax=Alteromonas confluentis TaxID=1656094 RepID=A0A1E7ZA36_9ALTE|nr:LysR family transcriptional regulator [Alteromonas confluentis]OFC70395.1 hypothetical protein BFC18_14610 [Alteromonas confluentis]